MADDTSQDNILDESTLTDEPVEQTEVEETESKEEPEQKTDESIDKLEEDEEEKTDEEAEEQETADESETPDPNELARQEYRERQQQRKQLEAIIGNQFRTQTPEELVEEQGLSEAEAKIAALEQKVELQNWRSSIIDLNANINTESLEVMKDYPVFDEKSPEYDKEFSTKVANMYQLAADIQFDETGEYVTNAKISPYDFYKEMADLRGSSVRKGKIEGAKSSEQMLSSSEPASRAVSKESAEEEDLFLKGFNRNPI